MRARGHLSVVLLLLGASTAPAAAAVYRVGADGACDFPTLTGALLAAAISAEADEIRLARNVTYASQYVHLTNWNPGGAGALTISGGWDDCADPTPLSKTILIARTQAVPVFEIDGASTVTLRRLQIQDSVVRGVVVEAGSDVILEQTDVWHNDGGGVYVLGGSFLRLDALSRVLANTANVGGAGIACFGAEVELGGDVYQNATTYFGGGIYAGDCVVTILDGAEIYLNDATEGGGIYAIGDTYVHAVGAGLGIAIRDNDAATTGGGVYAEGSLAFVTLEGVRVEENSAGDAGGGLFAFDGAVITLDRPATGCGSRRRCSTLSGNFLYSPGLDGAAAAAESGAAVRLYQTYVEGNGVPECCVGSILRASGAATRLRLEGVALWGNESHRLIEVADDAIADVAFVSATANGTAAIPVAEPLAVLGGAVARLNSSVFHPSAQIVLDAGGTLPEADCLIVSQLAHVPGGGTSVVAADPRFAAPAQGDLHLLPQSPAVDFCNAAAYPPAHGDGDGQARGYDLPSNPNGSPGVAGGLFDLGFDEVRPLFADGFETGDTSRWSSTTP